MKTVFKSLMIAGALLLPFGLTSANAANEIGKPICGQEFKGLAELMKEVRALPGARVVSEDAFYLAVQHPETNTIWTFTGQANPAKPSVICRRPVKGADGKLTLHMEVRCGAEQQACDNLTDAFKKLNAQMIERMQQGSQ